MIDDLRIIRSNCWGRGNLIDSVIDGIIAINSDYNISYRDGIAKNDILVAKYDI